MPKPNFDLVEVLEHLHDGLYITDKERRITFWNKAAEAITGYTAEEVMGRSCADNILVHVDAEGRSLCHGRCPLAASIKDEQPRSAEVFLRHKDGHRVPISARTNALRDVDGFIKGGVELFSDISVKEALAEKVEALKTLALVDDLTQIANRRRLEAEIEGAINLFKRSQISCGLLFLDVDHFKRFNDDYGHDVGDIALKAMARTLSRSTRSYDIVGRWGGEEFVILLKNADLKTLKTLADRVCALIRTTLVKAPAGDLQITASIGGTIVRAEDTPDSLIKRADMLMYQSKVSGRDRVTSAP